MDLTALADEIGSDDAVTCVGGRTQWDIGGPVAPGTREVRAPSGIDAIVPEEMTVRCGAGTPVVELDEALAERGQAVALPSWDGATVGGVLAVGRSGIRRLGYGPVRDTVLQLGVVSATGALVKAGGPTVKNVSGYDLCRLFVGSLGTLAILGEAILRTRPLPMVSRWFSGSGADPFELRRRLHAPTSLLWDGETTWLLLEGHPGDVEAQRRISGLDEVTGPPPLPAGRRWSIAPDEIRSLRGRFVAEVGVGVVHGENPSPQAHVDVNVECLHRRLKEHFDPKGRLNPGRDPLAVC
jgi:glycolate oxidase FAD binding subunit